jgi:hypothetical protein
MIDDFTTWKRTTEDYLWAAKEPVLTEAEAIRYFEAGLPPDAAVHRIIGDRNQTGEAECQP